MLYRDCFGCFSLSLTHSEHWNIDKALLCNQTSLIGPFRCCPVLLLAAVTACFDRVSMLVWLQNCIWDDSILLIFYLLLSYLLLLSLKLYAISQIPLTYCHDVTYMSDFFVGFFLDCFHCFSDVNQVQALRTEGVLLPTIFLTDILRSFKNTSNTSYYNSHAMFSFAFFTVKCVHLVKCHT